MATRNFSDLPNVVGGGVNNLTDEAQKYQELYNNEARTTSGQESYTATVSGQTYNTVDYPSDANVFNRGEDGLLKLLETYVIKDSLPNSDDYNNFQGAYDAIQDTFSLDLAKAYGEVKTADDGQDESLWAIDLRATAITADTVNNVLGNQAVSMTLSANSGTHSIVKEGISLDFNTLNNGQDSPQSDFIVVAVRCTDVLSVTGSTAISVRFSQDPVYSGTNSETINIDASLLTSGEWLYYPIKKTNSGTSGTGKWDGIQSIRFSAQANAGFAGEEVEFQYFQLVKSNASGTAPNPLESQGGSIITGEHVVVEEFGSINLKSLDTVTSKGAIVFDNEYNNFTAYCECVNDGATSTRMDLISAFIDESNYIFVDIEADKPRLIITEGGSANVMTGTENIGLVNGGKVSLTLTKKETEVFVNLISNGKLFQLSGVTSLNNLKLAKSEQAGQLNSTTALSITEIAHAYHADIAEVAGKVIQQPFMQASMTTPQSISSGIVIWDTEDYNDYSIYDASTGVVTIIESGDYMVTSSVKTTTGTINSFISRIHLDGTGEASYRTTDSGARECSLTDQFFNLTSGSTIDIRVTTTGTAADITGTFKVRKI